jgi:FAD/FMN-containing dehydrogenase
MTSSLIYAPSDSDSLERFMAECFRLASEGRQVSVRTADPDRDAGSVQDEASLEALPGDIEVMISLERLAGIVEISRPDMLLRAGSGTPVAHAAAAAREQGLWFPHYDESIDGAMSVAGLLMEAPGLPAAKEYGGLREYILSVEMVTGKGEKVRFGSRSVKDVAGYEVIGLLLGSGGRYGIVTEATLRLIPEPAEVPAGAVSAGRAAVPENKKLEELTDRIREVFDPAGILR